MNLELEKAKLKIALQNNTSKKTKLDTTGTIVPSRLAHYQTSKFLYASPIPDTGKAYKIDILLDVSGSMVGKRAEVAVQATQNLIKLLYGIVDFRVLAFGLGYYNLSNNQILSIDRNTARGLGGCLNHTMNIIGDNLLPLEGGYKKSWNGTHIPSVLKQSIEDLKSFNGDRIIILITDGEDNLDTINNTGVKYINGVSINTQYSNLLEEIDRENIKILPIGINIDLYNFPSSINIDDPEKIIVELINFLNNNIK